MTDQIRRLLSARWLHRQILDALREKCRQWEWDQCRHEAAVSEQDLTYPQNGTTLPQNGDVK